MPRERGWRPDVEARIRLDEGRLAAFCERWRMARLELFGSVLRDEFRPDSDVAVLVTFQPDADWGLLDHALMEEVLAGPLGRPVDLLTRRSVERSANPIRREAILASAEPLFTAPGATTATIAVGVDLDEIWRTVTADVHSQTADLERLAPPEQR